jgi:peptide/nickel transport system substrate-binding protein
MKFRLFTFVLLTALLATAGCRRRAVEVADYVDPHPLPEEPLIRDLPTVGSHGGRFVLGETNGPRTFNALMANETSSTDITDLLFTRLIGYDNAKQDFNPELAKSWEQSADGLTWTFHLRKGAKFSDGRDITSADVLFSFQVTFDQELHPAAQDQLVSNGRIPKVSAPDPYTFVIKTATPNAVMPMNARAVNIMPKHALEAAYKSGDFASAYNVSMPAEQIVTSGAFRVAQFVAGEKTVLGRNPYWFGVDQEKQRLPYLNELVFLVVPDQDAADLKFRSGGLDGVDDVKPENYRWYEENQEKGNYTLYSLGPAVNSHYFWFNLNKVQKPTPGKKVGDPFVDPGKYAWFSNPVFRRAVSMAIDRDAIIRSIFFGYGVKSWSQATESNKVWFNPNIVKYDQNPEEAKKLLASMGLKDANGDGVLEDARGNQVSFTLKTNSSNQLRIAMANFIKDDLAKVGIRVVFVPVDFNTLVTNLRNDFQYEAILLGLQSGVPPDPLNGQNVYRSSGLTHHFFPSQLKPGTPEEARIDHLMDVMLTTADVNDRRKDFYEIGNIWNEQCWNIWLPVQEIKVPMSNRFGNLQPSILAHRLLWNIERVYLKPRES